MRLASRSARRRACASCRASRRASPSPAAPLGPGLRVSAATGAAAGLPLLAGAFLRGRNVDELFTVAEAGFECLCFHAVDLSGEVGDFAVQIHDGIGAVVAAGDVVGAFFERPDERPAGIAAVPSFRDFAPALRLADAGSFLALLVAKVFLLVAVGIAVLAPVVLHAGGKLDIVVAGIFLRDGAKFLVVVRERHGFHFFGVDARPDDVAVLAPVFDVNNDGAGLVAETEHVFGAADEIVIVLAVERALRVVRIDGERVEILDALRSLGLRVPFGKRAVQVLRDRAAHVGDFNAVVVVSVEQMGGELLPAGALIAFRDHQARVG